MVNATVIWLLVLMQGTPNTGYAAQIMFKTDQRAVCESTRQKWLAAWPMLASLPDRLKCVEHRPKEIEGAFYQ